MTKVLFILVVIILVVGSIFLVTKIFKTPAKNADSSTTAQSNSSSTKGANIDVSEGLQQQDTKVGAGASAKSGNILHVTYTGTLEDGTVFDSNTGKAPFSFNLGSGEVIKGWDMGFVGMKVGGVRKLTIPPALGYGDQANAKIPANSTLLFTVELNAIN